MGSVSRGLFHSSNLDIELHAYYVFVLSSWFFFPMD